MPDKKSITSKKDLALAQRLAELDSRVNSIESALTSSIKNFEKSLNSMSRKIDELSISTRRNVDEKTSGLEKRLSAKINTMSVGIVIIVLTVWTTIAIIGHG